MNLKIKLFFLSILYVATIGCNDNDSSLNENRKENNNSSNDSITNEIVMKRDKLMAKFDDSDPNESEEDYYYLILHTSFDTGISVKFRQDANEYFLEVKTLHPKDSINRLTQNSYKMDESEWMELESIIDEFDFWTAVEFKPSRPVLDGYIYILEGSRLTNNGTLHNLVLRQSPRYDKIGALCEYLYQFEEDLVFQYEQYIE